MKKDVVSSKLYVILVIAWLLFGGIGGCAGCSVLAQDDEPGRGLLVLLVTYGLGLTGVVLLGRATENRTSTVGRAFAIGCIVVGCLAPFIGAAIASRMQPSTASLEGDKCGAWVMAQHFVRQELKAPATARFDDGVAGSQGCDNAVALATAATPSAVTWMPRIASAQESAAPSGARSQRPLADLGRWRASTFVSPEQRQSTRRGGLR